MTCLSVALIYWIVAHYRIKNVPLGALWMTAVGLDLFIAIVVFK